MDNFDLKKFLKESKAIENLNPTFKSLNENESREERADVDKREAMKKKIKEMIVAELEGKDLEDATKAAEQNPKDKKPESNLPSADLTLHMAGVKEETDTDLMDPIFEDELEEAKKKKDEDVEDVEDVEVTDTTEEVPAEDMPADEAPAVDGGLEDIAADMKGTEADLMDNLMKAFQIAKGMNNEKLETQVGNTLKFFVSEYIGGGEQ